MRRTPAEAVSLATKQRHAIEQDSTLQTESPGSANRRRILRDRYEAGGDDHPLRRGQRMYRERLLQRNEQAYGENYTSLYTWLETGLNPRQIRDAIRESASEYVPSLLQIRLTARRVFPEIIIPDARRKLKEDTHNEEAKNRKDNVQFKITSKLGLHYEKLKEFARKNYSIRDISRETGISEFLLKRFIREQNIELRPLPKDIRKLREAAIRDIGDVIYLSTRVNPIDRDIAACFLDPWGVHGGTTLNDIAGRHVAFTDAEGKEYHLTPEAIRKRQLKILKELPSLQNPK
jgi:AraC-like DNA-binding protein